MENKLLIDQQRRQRDAKRFFFLWLRRLIVGYVLCMSIYFVWMFAIQGVTIEYVGNVQRNYAKFLVEQNDEFIGYMIEFEGLTAKTKTVYTDGEKQLIKENLEKQNAFLKKIQKRSPNGKNADYLDLYQDMLQIYAFYIQGEIMKAEYCYQYDTNFTLENSFSGSGASLESYTMGQELCNMMGNMILNNFKYINEIRGTNYSSKHNILEMGNSSNNTDVDINDGNSDESKNESTNGDNDIDDNENVENNTNTTPDVEQENNNTNNENNIEENNEKENQEGDSAGSADDNENAQ